MPVVNIQRIGAGTPPSLDDLLALLNPALDWKFNEASQPVINLGSAGSAYDLSSELGTPDYQVDGAGIAEATLAAHLDGDVTAEGWNIDDTTAFAAFNIAVGGIFLIARYTGDYVTVKSEENMLFTAEAVATEVGRTALSFREPQNGNIDFTIFSSTFDIDIQLRTLRDYTGDQAFHLIWIVQKGDSTGPDIYVDRFLDTNVKVVDPGEENKWLATNFASWVNATIGYRGTVGGDGTTSDGNGEADITIDRLAFTTIAPSLAEIEAIFDAYMGLPTAIYTDGNAPVGTSARGWAAVFYDSLKEGTELIGGMPNGSLFTTQIWTDCCISPSGQFLAATLSSTGDKCEWAEWDPALRKWDRNGAAGSNVGWVGSFKTGCDFYPAAGGELLLALGETSRYQELAQWDGSDFNRIVTDPFDVQHGTNVFCGGFYNGGENILIGGGITGGIVARVFDRVADDNWDYDGAAIDTQPQAGAGTTVARRGGFAASAAHVAMFTFNNGGPTTEVRIWSYDGNGDLTTVATNDHGVGAASPQTYVGLAFTPNGRFLYQFASDNGGGSSTHLECRDRDNSWNSVTLTGWSDVVPIGTDIAISPDGEYLMLIYQNSTGLPSELYKIESDGDVTFIRSMIIGSNPASAAGSHSGAFSGAYYNG